MRTRTAMMMTELRIMMIITAQVGITRIIMMGGGEGGRGLLLSMSYEERSGVAIRSVLTSLYNYYLIE